MQRVLKEQLEPNVVSCVDIRALETDVRIPVIVTNQNAITQMDVKVFKFNRHIKIILKYHVTKVHEYTVKLFLFVKNQCLLIVKLLLGRWDVILWVTDLLH